MPFALTVTANSAHADLSLITLIFRSITIVGDNGGQSVSLNGQQEDSESVSLRSTADSMHVTLKVDYSLPVTTVVSLSIGDVTAKPDGKWKAGPTSTVKSDLSSITLTVPKNVAMEINASTVSGYFDATRFTKRGKDTYLNETTNANSITKCLHALTSIGVITIRTGGSAS